MCSSGDLSFSQLQLYGSRWSSEFASYITENIFVVSQQVVNLSLLLGHMWHSIGQRVDLVGGRKEFAKMYLMNELCDLLSSRKRVEKIVINNVKVKPLHCCADYSIDWNVTNGIDAVACVTCKFPISFLQGETRLDCV